VSSRTATPTVRPALCSWAVGGVLFAGTVLLFSRALDYGFSNYDDPHYITANPQVQAGFTWPGIVWAFTGKTDYWHPLTWLSHMLDWQLHGSAAAGHHLTSVLWHAANAVLAFVVLRRLTGAFWTSAFSAALFAWHPLRVESVAWITERKDVMSGFFFLLTLWAYAGYAARRRESRRAWPCYLLTLALFVGGLMCKPVIVALPLVLLVLDFWPLARITPALGNARELLFEKIPFFLLSAATSVVTVLMQQENGAFTLPLPFAARVGNAVVSVVRYVGKFFWPFDLTPFYPHPGYWPAWVVAGAIVVVVGLTVAAWRQRRARPWLLAGWLWFVVMLLPVIGLIQVGLQAMADRYTYLPAFGLEIALLWTLRDLLIRPAARRIAGASVVVVLAACAARTWNQQATWRDPITFFSHAIAVTDANDPAEGFLAYTLVGLGRFDEAAPHCERALAINPRNETALFALAHVRDHEGKLDEATAACRTILRQNPTDGQTEYLLGTLLLRQNRDDEAVAHMKTALALRPDFAPANLRVAMAEIQRGVAKNALARYAVAVAFDPRDAAAHFGRGLAFAQLGQVDSALTSYETAARLRPDFALAHVQIGVILLDRHQSSEAAAHFRAALASQPKLAMAHYGLARAAEQLGQTDEATASYERALERAPNDPVTRRGWAETLARRGQFAEAAIQYERAVALRPGDAGLRTEFGYALFLAGLREDAVAQWEEALRLDPNFPGLRERLGKLRER